MPLKGTRRVSKVSRGNITRRVLRNIRFESKRRGGLSGMITNVGIVAAEAEAAMTAAQAAIAAGHHNAPALASAAADKLEAAATAQRHLSNAYVMGKNKLLRSVRERLQNARKKEKETLQQKRAEIAFIFSKLKKINKQLKVALKIYNEQLEISTAGPLIDAVAILLDAIKSELEDYEDEFEEFNTPEDEDDVYEYILNFTEYIDENILSGYEKASLPSMAKRNKKSHIIIEILGKIIKRKARDLNNAIKESKKVSNNNDLAMAVDDMIQAVGYSAMNE